MLSRFAAQVSGSPSSVVSKTSVGILRIVDVMGATVTLFSTAIAESRVRISTGRRLLGAGNVYQQTSPRFNNGPNPVDRARRRIRPAMAVALPSRPPDLLRVYLPAPPLAFPPPPPQTHPT